MSKDNIDYFKSIPVNIPKITILLDNGYQERKNHTGVKKNLSCDYDQNSVETITKTIIGTEKTGRKNRVCSRQSKVGHFSYQLSVISYQLSAPLVKVRGLKY